MAFSRLSVARTAKFTTLMSNQLRARMIGTEAPTDLNSDTAVKLLKETPVMVYAKSYCPHCARARSILDNVKANYTYMNLDKIKQGGSIQASLAAEYGQRTVPMVFLNSKLLGGGSETAAADADGSLVSQLQELNALES